MFVVVYMLVVFLATFVGASTGLGGGVIIKPALDIVGHDTATIISVYSSLAVFTMCVVAIYRRMKLPKEFPIRGPMAASLAGGAVCGGIVGERIFRLLVGQWDNQQVSLVQSAVLSLVLVMIVGLSVGASRLPKFHIQNRLAIGVVGFGVGALSVFLGIGGGPLNMVLLLYLFSMPAKEAAFYSLVMIFFSQLTKVVAIIGMWSGLALDIWVVGGVLLCAILGGVVGIHVQRRLEHSQVMLLYNVLMVVLLAMTVFNFLVRLF